MFYITMEVRDIICRDFREGIGMITTQPAGMLWDLYTPFGPFEGSGEGSLKDHVRKKLEEILKAEVVAFQMLVFDITNAGGEK